MRRKEPEEAANETGGPPRLPRSSDLRSNPSQLSVQCAGFNHFQHRVKGNLRCACLIVGAHIMTLHPERRFITNSGNEKCIKVT